MQIALYCAIIFAHNRHIERSTVHHSELRGRQNENIND